ncbi:VCBS repeat-containing protein [Conexibacter sp. W3-3-2]|uniref:FG-GAP repeat domain-containing protein n=1 Tax=Conexibacter sp. W3-3-2 TaxID=2675227 RepID=UPI001E369EE7|nr:VCBS repeat-containing protein [Conexibacter sp. W3-3-2]
MLRVHAGDGTVRPPLVASLPTGIAPQNPVIADFTGDGRPDIVVAGPDRIDLLRNTTP